MIYGFPTWVFAVVLGVLGGAAAVFVGYQFSKPDQEEPLEEFRNEYGDLMQEVEIEPPRLRGSRGGIIGEVVKTWRYLNKTERLAGNGYVKWYLIDDTFPKPKFVKPEDDGTGIPRVKTDDGVYLFPRKAAKASSENGMWTFLHQKGDAEPLNIHDYRETVITPEEAEEWLTQAVSSERPTSGLADIIPDDIDPSMIVGGAIALAVLYAVMSGGL